MKNLLKGERWYGLLLLAAFLFGFFAPGADAQVRAVNKSWDYACASADLNHQMTLAATPAGYGGADFRVILPSGQQIVIEDAAPIKLEGNRDAFFHPETRKSAELLVIVLGDGSQVVTKYGSKIYTCGLTSEYDIVDFK
ncbi:hypothetical protein KYLE_76 [Pantoea phage Kyle]|uniref:Uncharacterized protein n=1 Tax=Pantoea phage Kyle TaxID=2589665 RepID=A0A514A8T6_9CAUD|nr:hypothetical protein HWC52_gp076 [Pantoea phage Kyle]QDH49665.1 hypothetical protein KYLE_76 [Pantoea phage Kyle]